MGQRYGIAAIALAFALVGQPYTWANLPEPEHLAQVTPNTVTGRLDENSDTLNDGSYLNIYTFEGTAGDIIVIDLVSADFDAYLILMGPEGNGIAQDNDGGDSTNARLAVTLPATGTYQVVANSYGAGETGQYTLTWRSGTAADVAQLHSSPSQAQVTANTVTGRLDGNSPTLDNGIRFGVQGIEGVAGETITIEVTSTDFIPRLVVFDLEAEEFIGNTTRDTTARLSLTWPRTGAYLVTILGSGTNSIGSYQLQWRQSTATEVNQQAALDRATALNEQAVELYQVGRYSEAEPLFQQTLTIRRQQLGETHPNVATSLNNLASLYRAQGHYSEAEPLFQQALTIRRQQLGETHPNVATSLNNLAGLYQDQGRYSEAEPLFQQTLTIRRQQLGETHPDVAQSFNNLAGLYYAQGRYREVEPLFQQALTIYRQALGNSHPDVATSLNNLASLYQDQGRYSEAEPLYQQALTIRRQALGNSHPDVATSLNNLALLYYAQGRYGEAEPLFQQALTIRRQQLGHSHPNVAQSLNNLAGLYYAQGRYREVEHLYQQALTIYRQQLGETHPLVATSLNNLALLYQDQGRYREAEPLFQQALTIRRQQLGHSHPNVATSLNNLAVLYQDQGRYREAERLFQQALTIYRQQLGETHPNVATSFNNLTLLYQAQGNIAQALTSLQAGLAIQELHLDFNLATLADAQRQAYVATISGSSQYPISLHLQSAPTSPEAEHLALTTLLRRKGRILDAGTNSLQVLRQNLTPDDQATLDQLTDTQRQLANLTFNPPPDLPPDQYRAQLEFLETTANQLESTLARSSAAFRAETTPVEIAAVQAQIPADGVLVEYVRYQPFNAQDPPNQWGADRYAAYLLFPSGRIEAVDLGEAAEIDAAVNSFVSLLQDTRAGLQRGATITLELDPARVATATDTIRALVFDPIAPHLQGRSHLLISPDAQLNLLPFEALQPETGGDYLVQQYQISYLNTGRDLVRFGVIPPSRNPAVLVGNPNYDTATVQVASSRGDSQRATVLGQLQFGPLPGTAAELTALEPLFPNASILEGDEATENALKQVQSPRILHIATHGFFLADVEREQADSRGFGLSTRGDSLTSGIPVDIAVENPLLRSGLALAGFNTRSSGDEDGVLTALEASQLNLFGTQLVVLSACDTGLGDVANGEGVYGLRRAFSIAGAETQLLSLWQVSDFGTQSLMARYYEKLMAGMGRSEALRAVQLEMIAEGGQYSHPYYWAAFVLAGNVSLQGVTARLGFQGFRLFSP